MTRAGDAGRLYADRAYVEALSEFGALVHLPRSGGWLLRRPIAGTDLDDLMGPYPLFSCRDWTQLEADLNELTGAVSLTLVADPLDGVPLDLMRTLFPDHLMPFKRHLVRDLTKAAALPSHHRRHLRRARDSVDVEISTGSTGHLDEWVDLYEGLVERHSLVGVRAFSTTSFRRQLALPGMLAVRAERDGATVAMTLWLTDGVDAYYHLGASSDAGRRVSASYALFAAALDHLRERGVRHVDLGAGAGSESEDDGLSRFKRGWANQELPAYVCGRIFDRSAYTTLAAAVEGRRGWFPAYRAADPDMALPLERGTET